MTVSVIVATLDRPDHVRTLLTSLAANTRLPDEVVIVEQGDVSKLEPVIQEFKSQFSIKTIFQKEKSLAGARDRGMQESNGEILIFCDDDIEFNQIYIATTCEYLSTHLQVLGLTGSYMHNVPTWTMRRLLGVMFCIYSFKKGNIVLPSGAYDYVRGTNLHSEQVVEWLYGCNMVLRRKVFDLGFGFYTQFIRWSYGEDVIATYPIHKRFSGSLRFLPNLKVVHNEGTESKMLNIEVVRMKVIYRYIFWRREVYGGKWWRVLAYVWSQVGLSGLELLQCPSFRILGVLFETYRYLVQNRSAIATGYIDYNSFIFQHRS